MSIKGFSVNGVVEKYDYNSLDNIPPDSGGSGSAFWATYGTTPFSDVLAAYNNQRTVMLSMTDKVLMLAKCDTGSAYFTCNQNFTTFYATVNSSNSWSDGSYWLVTDGMLMATTGDPSDLQTTAKTNLVAAINELHQQFASLTSAAGVSF